MDSKPELDNANVVSSVSKPINTKKHQNLISKNYENDSVTKNNYELFWENQGSGKPTQVERYEQHHAPDYILRFIRIGGGPRMGTTLEQFARFEFSCLQKRAKGKNTGYDHKITLHSKEIYIEQKSSGHWGENDYKWQHVEEKHKWNILLLCGIDYEEIHFWVMNRSVFVKLIEEKKITNQGAVTGESSEGLWFNYSDVAEMLIKIKTNEELLNYIHSI